MIHKVLVTPIIGLPQINGWSQVTQSSDGRFICAFAIQGSQAGNVGRDLVDLIKDNSPQSPSSVYSLMKRIIRFIDEKDCKIEISASYINNGQTIFTAYNGSLLLKRAGKVGSLLHAQDEIKIIEGKRNPEDIFVLLSNTSLEFKEEIFQKLSQGLDADTTVASIIPGVQNLSNSSLIAMTFLSDLPDDYEPEGTDESVEEPLVEFSEDDDEIREEESELGKPIIEAQTKKGKVSIDKAKLLTYLSSLWHILQKIMRLVWISGKKIYRSIRQLFTTEVYVDEKTKKTKNIIRAVFVAIIVIIMVLIGVLLYRMRVNAQVVQAQEEVEPIMLQYEEAKQQADESPIETRDVIAGIIADLEAKQKAFSQQQRAEQYVIEKLDEVRTYYDSISGKEAFQELAVFYDFQLVESDFIAGSVSLDGDFAYFLDKDKKKIIQLDTNSKSVQTFDFPDLETIAHFTVDDEFLYLLSAGIYEQSIENPEDELIQVAEEGTSNEGADLITVFTSNLYVLNVGQRNIYKYSYSESDEEYLDPVRWVTSARGLEFDQVISMVIDGDIWLSTKDGKIFNLRGGEGEQFVINGLQEPLSSQTFMYTNPDLENIYLLEPSNSRIIVVDKNGDFVKEIESISLASASNIAVNKDGTRALVISGSLVFEVEL